MSILKGGERLDTGTQYDLVRLDDRIGVKKVEETGSVASLAIEERLLRNPVSAATEAPIVTDAAFLQVLSGRPCLAGGIPSGCSLEDFPPEEPEEAAWVVDKIRLETGLHLASLLDQSVTVRLPSGSVIVADPKPPAA